MLQHFLINLMSHNVLWDYVLILRQSIIFTNLIIERLLESILDGIDTKFGQVH